MQFEMPDNPDELKSWMEELEASLSKEVEEGREARDKAEEIRLQEQALKAQILELALKRQELDAERDRARREARAKEQVLELARQKYKTFMSDKAIADQLKQKAEEFKNKTLGAPWREWAFDHQIDGATRAATATRCILGDKRGLGKTLTSIIWMDMVGAKKTLVFAPKDVLRNFGREIEHWAPNRKYVVLGGMPKKERNQFLDMCGMGLVDELLLLVNYEAWRRDAGILQKLIAIGFDTIVIDEAHNIKTSSTEAFQGIKQIVHADNKCNICGGKPEQKQNPVTKMFYIRCSSCLHEPEEFGDFHSVKNLMPMTGTAILNKPQDLWTLLHLVDPVAFPRESAFLKQYCENAWGRWRFKYGGTKRLTNALGMKYIARDEKTAGVTMPKQDVTHHYVTWDDEAKARYPKQAKVMRQIQEFGAIKMSEDVALNVIGILAELTRQRQAVVWPAGIKLKDPETGIVLYEADAHESIKMDKAEEIVLQAVEEEDRVVVFSKFKEALKEFERRLDVAGISAVRYDGDTGNEMRNAAQMDFDVKSAATHDWDTECTEGCPNFNIKLCRGYKWQVILCNYDTGGVGLNLNAARQTVILDREWNPGKEDQAQGRTQRLNTKHDTIVHIIHVEKTVDNFMDALMDQKAEMIEGFEDTNKLNEKMRNALMTGNYDT